jgi:hypothetical protein
VYGGYAPGSAEYLNDFSVPLVADVERGLTLQPHVPEAATLCISGALAAHVDLVTAAHLRRPLHAAALLLGYSHRAGWRRAAIAGRVATQAGERTHRNAAWARHGHGMGTAWARHGHGMGTAWARHGHGMGTAWAQHGHGMGMAWAWQVTDAAMLLESDGAGGLVLSSLPLSTTESGPHAARSRPSARCNHTATILGDSLYVYGGAAGSWEFDDVCRVELRMPPRAPTPCEQAPGRPATHT